MRNDDGFTLIELLVAIMVMGVIVATIATAILVMFRTTEETTQRLSESPDLQIAAAYFGSDVQSAQSLPNAPVGITCGPGTALITFSWTDPGTDPAAAVGDTTRTAAYVVSTAGSQKQLVRYYCIGSGAPAVTALVNFLSPTTMPVVQCFTDAGVNTPCGSTTRTVRVHDITICTANPSLACKNDPLTFELKASRRST